MFIAYQNDAPKGSSAVADQGANNGIPLVVPWSTAVKAICALLATRPDSAFTDVINKVSFINPWPPPLLSLLP